MSKVNIFILCIFLLHFVAVANKEQSFLKLKGDSKAKYEFALNDQTKAGQLEEFKNGLGSRNGEFTFQSLSEEEDEKKYLRSLDDDTPNDRDDQNPDNENDESSSNEGDDKKNSKESKKTKSKDWKTLNTKSETKALKRYRIVNTIVMNEKKKK